jgi:hypothetical protein
MSYAAKVLKAGDPRAAMLVLGFGIDAILAKLDAQPAPVDHPWGEWAEIADAPSDAALKLEIDRVDEALRTETDASARAALEAKLRLLKDNGGTVENVLPGDEYGADEHGIVTVPPASEERQNTRRAWALQRNLGSAFLGMDDEEAADAFAKGGPVWLYYGNRPAIMQMPDDWKRALVIDVEQDSPRLAQSLGRDVLKDLDPGAPNVTMESMGSEWEANHG